MEIIAEIGQNHNGDIQKAIDMIKIAKEYGADVAKFQLYDAKVLFPKEGNPWYDYNCQTELSKDDVMRLAEACRRTGIEFMASVFDTERIDWLEEAGVKRHKVASRSIREKDLIESLCQCNKPLIVSLGMWDEDTFPQLENKAGIDFLYCVSKYPTPLEEMHLEDIDFHTYAGLSDHTIGISSAIYACTKGARILEKHFTLNKTEYGPDHACSMSPEELKAIDHYRNDLKELV